MNDSQLLQICNEYLKYKDGQLIWIKKASKNTVIGSIAGYTRPSKYMTIKLNHKMYLLHRLIFFINHGYFPKYIDHINGVRNDNRIENLRECTHSQNHQNKKIPISNSSGYKGVSKAKGGVKWRARLKINGKEYHIGTFPNTVDAAKAYNKKAIEIYGDFACLNEIPNGR